MTFCWREETHAVGFVFAGVSRLYGFSSANITRGGRVLSIVRRRDADKTDRLIIISINRPFNSSEWPIVLHMSSLCRTRTRGTHYAVTDAFIGGSSLRRSALQWNALCIYVQATSHGLFKRPVFVTRIMCDSPLVLAILLPSPLPILCLARRRYVHGEIICIW